MKRSPFLEDFERQKDLCRAWFNSDLIDADREWLRQHIELAGQTVPDYDISWFGFETVGWR